MTDLSQMGQLLSSELTGEAISDPDVACLTGEAINDPDVACLTGEPCGFTFPLLQQIKKTPMSSPFPLSQQIKETSLSLPFTRPSTEAPTSLPFTRSSTDAPTSLTEALQLLDFARNTIDKLTSKNEQLKTENQNLVHKLHKLRSKNKAEPARRGRPQKDMLWDQLTQLTSNEDDTYYWYTRLLDDCRLARQLLRVTLCRNGDDCIYGDSCRFAHSEAQQMRARSNWDCPNVDCTGEKCMWRHPEKTVSENTDE